MTEFSLGLTAK